MTIIHHTKPPDLHRFIYTSLLEVECCIYILGMRRVVSMCALRTSASRNNENVLKGYDLLVNRTKPCRYLYVFLRLLFKMRVPSRVPPLVADAYNVVGLKIH